MKFQVFKGAFLLLGMLWFHGVQAQSKTYVDLSKRLVNAIRYENDYSLMVDSLKNVTPDGLAQELDNDDAKKAFWINVYNSYIQIILTQNPALFEENRSKFFQEPQISIAGKLLSFEDIEHGIIRRSKARLGLGILPKWFPGKFERQMRTKKVDARVHFALNCGAKSCPPVAAYDYRRIEEQLEKMTIQHLEKYSRYDAAQNTVFVPKLLQWFSGDFGIGKRKKRRFLAKHGAIPEGSKPTIQFDAYDWTLFLKNFTDA